MLARGSRIVGGIALVLAVALSACSSVSGSDLSPGSLVSGGRDPAAEQKALQEFAPVAVCPPVQVRDGTQLMRVFDKGKQDDFSAIRFQASISQFARECHTDPASGVTTIKVGIAGRMLAGPTGATGAASLPLRVVLVRDGDQVLYSQLFAVDAAIASGMAAVDWSKIVEGVTVPADKASGNLVIYVGFDQSGAKDKPAKKAKS